MSRTTKTIPRSTLAVVATCAAVTLAANALLILHGGAEGLLLSVSLGTVGVALQMARQRLSRVTTVSLCDLPLIFAMLTLNPGMAMLVGTIVGVVPRGRLGNQSCCSVRPFAGVRRGASTEQRGCEDHNAWRDTRAS